MKTVPGFAVACGLVALLMPCLPGCGHPSPDDSELGEVIYRLPDIPGGEKPYPLPQLDDDPSPPPGSPHEEGDNEVGG